MNEKLTKEEARQGRQGLHVRNILVISLVLAAIAFFAVYFYGESIDEDIANPVENSSTSETTETNENAGSDENTGSN